MTGPGPQSTAGDPGRGGSGWHAWGPEVGDLEPHLHALLTRELGPLPARDPGVPLAAVRVGPSRLPPGTRTALAGTVGAAHVHDDHETRVRHAGGRSYVDLVRRRAGDALDAPDVVVRPGTHAEVTAVLAVCEQERVAVVPFGGGTSVVGGVEPDRGRFAGVVTLDLARLDRLLGLDPTSLVATFEAGIRAPMAEAQLRGAGFTLGHYPQSYAFATLGGMAATRSAGQASTGYGRIDDLVVGARVATPIGTLTVGHGTPTAAGPDLTALVTGSEGCLGILTEVTLRVRPLPASERYEAWALPSFAHGAAAVRALIQSEAAADVVRLSDEEETRLLLAQAGGWQATALERYLRMRGLRRPSLLVLGWDGSDEVVTARRRRARAVLAARRARPLGGAPGRAWAAGRFAAPHLRDRLLDHGVMVETLETAGSWQQLGELYLAVRAAVTDTLDERGTPPLVLTHLSHVYPTGASLYLTWLARQQRGAEIEQWQAVKQAAGDAIMAHGGTITHHHAIGRDHRPWLPEEIGEVGVAALAALKGRLDPHGILNPGKLLPHEVVPPAP